ncbi:MAG: helicase-related protein [Anaerolineae bacterium]|jgi:superfamily II DNA or RNA helicase|nr:helicase-related protein [Anaerolineae bacterium]
MPRIFDNIDQKLLPALQETLDVAYRADFCVGYFNLRGWREIDARIESWTGGDTDFRCRLLVGMHRPPEAELHAALGFRSEEKLDNRRVLELKKKLAQEFRDQLTIGAPTNADEAGLRHLAQQLKAGKLVVKLFLRHPLHAKLYLLHRQDVATPIIGFMGSSNLTFSGLEGQGELNIDVLEQDAASKLARWFEDRWEDHWCVDISAELAEIIEESWAGETPIPPYYIYLKMAYHLSQEARAGLTEFHIPTQLYNTMFDFQSAAVKIAARHLNQRGGVLIGDVVGLGKTLMATAVAKVFEEDYLLETLIICPKNLVKMWEFYRDEYHLRAKVLPITRVLQDLPNLRRYRLVLIDESHNLRNPEGKRYRAIRDYIQRNDARCILLSATPYNKTYLDLSAQLRLFVPEEADLGLRPERLLREIGIAEFNNRYQCPLSSLQAFEKSGHADDWRELMSLYMVRRTRSFIRDNYARADAEGRKYLEFPDGTRAYFPARIPKTLRFNIDENDPHDQYARLYAEPVVETLNTLHLPRYGMGNYVRTRPKVAPTAQEKHLLDDLSRGGRRLMGFCRTNLFKRLESSGYAFLLSVERHILRNAIFIYALEHNLPLPIGTQGAEMLDTRFEDEDAEAVDYDTTELFDDQNNEASAAPLPTAASVLRSAADFAAQAALIYQQYATRYKSRFRWIRADLFTAKLRNDLQEDTEALLGILNSVGEWDAARDAKLNTLSEMLATRHSTEKVLIFSQFADTVCYLEQQLHARGMSRLAGVTGSDEDPTAQAWRFSPVSNNQRAQTKPEEELQVLVATDVLSEGQNLQDGAIVVNYDLPWAIIRLIQRAGRVDRIGQRAAQILCYTFWPAEGVERLIRLRERLRQRLHENAEVVGTDEAFFEDDAETQPLLNLYHEQSGSLDDEQDTEIDLVSYAYQIWKNATDANPALKVLIPKLSPVVYATKGVPDRATLSPAPPGVLVYLRSGESHTGATSSALAWIDQEGRSVTESQFAVLRAAECALDTPALPRQEQHHELVRAAVEHILTERKTVGGQLGRPSGARCKTYTRLEPYARRLRGTLFEELPRTQALFKAIEQLYQFPLQETAAEKLNRQLRSGVQDEQLVDLVVTLYEDDRLCLVQEDSRDAAEPQIICSLGLVDLAMEAK